jgi:hypothetical protein
MSDHLKNNVHKFYKKNNKIKANITTCMYTHIHTCTVCILYVILIHVYICEASCNVYHYCMYVTYYIQYTVYYTCIQ